MTKFHLKAELTMFRGDGRSFGLGSSPAARDRWRMALTTQSFLAPKVHGALRHDADFSRVPAHVPPACELLALGIGAVPGGFFVVTIAVKRLPQCLQMMVLAMSQSGMKSLGIEAQGGMPDANMPLRRTEARKKYQDAANEE